MAIRDRDRFRALAQRHGALNYEFFSQKMVVAATNLPRGACYALTVFWLAYWRRHPVTPEHFGRAFFTDIHQNTALRMQPGQQAEGVVSDLDAAQRNQHDELEARRYFGRNHLERAGLHRRSSTTYGGGLLSFERAGLAMVRGPGYYMMKLRTHAVGAIVRDGQFLFFDPNFGEVALPDAARFIRFIGSFMCNRRIHGVYQGRHLPRVILDRYQ